MNYIVYDTVEIKRAGISSSNSFKNEAKDGEFIMEGKANDATQKVEFDGLDIDGQPVNPRVVDKTPEEIEAEKPPEIPFEKQTAHITNEQWQDVINRLDNTKEA